MLLRCGMHCDELNQIPPHDVWVSGFCGDCAVTRHIRPAAGASILCDLDEAVLRRWIPRQRPLTRLLHVDCIPWLRFAFELDQMDGPGTVAGSAGDAGEDAVCSDARSIRQPGCGAYFRGVVPGLATPSIFLYLDPPYLSSLRRKRRIYKYDMDESQHVELLRVIVRLPCYVLLHGYPSSLYSQHLQQWRTWTYRAMTRGGQVTEQCWANYPQPVRLHDYRYVGSNKRERERIRRRCLTWSAGLARVTTAERGAILQAIADRAAQSGGW